MKLSHLNVIRVTVSYHRYHNMSSDTETPTSYKKGGFHPVRIGDRMSHYIIVEKLGFGHYSTVWKGYDENVSTTHPNKLVAIKIQKSNIDYSDAALDEILMVEQVHEDGVCPFVVNMIDKFEHHGPHGTHWCMVYELMRMDMYKFYNQYAVSPQVLKWVAFQLLNAVKRLHSKHIIHTDIKPDNVLLSLPYLENPEKLLIKCKYDREVSRRAELELLTYAGLSKNAKRRTKEKLEKIKKTPLPPDGDDMPDYIERNKPYPFNVKLGDMGAGCWTYNKFGDDIVTRPYRPPEVFLRCGYSNSVDIWSVACTLYEIATGECLFYVSSKSKHREEEQLAQIMEVCGTIPKWMLKTGKHTSKYFKRDFTLKHTKISQTDLCDRMINEVDPSIWSADECVEFIEFLYPMLLIDPKKRYSAAKMLESSWLIDVKNTYKKHGLSAFEYPDELSIDETLDVVSSSEEESSDGDADTSSGSESEDESSSDFEP